MKYESFLVIDVHRCWVNLINELFLIVIDLTRFWLNYMIHLSKSSRVASKFRFLFLLNGNKQAINSSDSSDKINTSDGKLNKSDDSRDPPS